MDKSGARCQHEHVNLATETWMTTVARMSKVKEERPKTFTEYVQLVERLQTPSAGSLWFRGCGRAAYKLLPSLYRHRTKTSLGELAILERQVMTRFRQRSIPLHSRSLADDWDTLFFMQHYLVPTRLLDWSESPFVGLYFAVMTAPFTYGARGKLKFQEDAALWILDPVKWNRHSLRHHSYDGGILSPGDDPLKGFKPASSFTGMHNHPVAIYGAHNSPRIVAQRGVFAIFGQDVKPMETVFDDDRFPDGSLTKVILKWSLIQEFRTAILNHGITESVVFPDLEGLAREIKRGFDFEA